MGLLTDGGGQKRDRGAAQREGSDAMIKRWGGWERTPFAILNHIMCIVYFRKPFILRKALHVDVLGFITRTSSPKPSEIQNNGVCK